jgi:hypothetical protein
MMAVLMTAMQERKPLVVMTAMQTSKAVVLMTAEQAAGYWERCFAY